MLRMQRVCGLENQSSLYIRTVLPLFLLRVLQQIRGDRSLSCKIMLIQGSTASCRTRPHSAADSRFWEVRNPDVRNSLHEQSGHDLHGPVVHRTSEVRVSTVPTPK